MGLKENLAKAIDKSLASYRCQHTRDEEGDGSQLVDVLSPLETVAEGQDELILLRDHLFWGILSLTETRKEKCPMCNGDRLLMHVYPDPIPCVTCHGARTITRKATLAEIVREWKGGGK